MINKSAFRQEDMSNCPISLTASSPSSPVNDGGRASSTFNPRTAPNCARCKNHGIKNPLKGHKRYCRYWNCLCERCEQTAKRQQVMARETAHRRARKLHEAKIMEYRKAQERARLMGEKSPEPPVELLSPILSPEKDLNSSDGSDIIDVDPRTPDGSASIISDSGVYVPRPQLKLPAPTNLFENGISIRGNEEPSTSEKVDLRSSLRTLQELFLHENYPLETTSLLYVILKDTPEPRKAYNRIVEAQNELAASFYSREDGLNLSVYLPQILRPSLFPHSFLPSAAFSISPSYYPQYNAGNTPLPLSPACRYPYLSRISTLRNPSDFLSCSQSLTYLEDGQKNRLNFDPIQIPKDDRPRPSNLCIRETSSFSVSETK